MNPHQYCKCLKNFIKNVCFCKAKDMIHINFKKQKRLVFNRKVRQIRNKKDFKKTVFVLAWNIGVVTLQWLQSKPNYSVVCLQGAQFHTSTETMKLNKLPLIQCIVWETISTPPNKWESVLGWRYWFIF